MNPLVFLILVGGGYYYYKKSKEKDADRQRALEGETCVAVERLGAILMCEGNACRGIKTAPGVDPKNNPHGAEIAQRMNAAVTQVLGARPWASEPNEAQGRQVVNVFLKGIFPECNWAELPASTQMEDGTLGLGATALTLIIKGMYAADQGGAEPPPLGEQTVDAHGLRLYMAGPNCIRIGVDGSAGTENLFEERVKMHAGMFQGAEPSLNIAEQVLANTLTMYFPQCPWPPASPDFLFQGEDGETNTWEGIALGILTMMQAEKQGMANMPLTPGNLGALGTLAIQQNPGLAPRRDGCQPGSRPLGDGATWPDGSPICIMESVAPQVPSIPARPASPARARLALPTRSGRYGGRY
jgi:hypothetical protein